MKTRRRRWRRPIVLAALAATTLAAMAMPACGGGGGTGGFGGAGPGSSSDSSSSYSSSSLSSSSHNVSVAVTVSGSTTASASSGGCVMPPCPGDTTYTVSLMQMPPLEIDGTTLSQCTKSYYHGYCGIGNKGSGPELLYAVQPTEDGTMHVELDADGWQGVVYAIAPGECKNPNHVLTCSDANPGPPKLAFKATQGEVYPIVVDGRDGESGPFTLKVTLAKPICGDGVIDPPDEVCDFGEQGSPWDGGAPSWPEDGCDNCKFIGPPDPDSSDSCPAVPGVGLNPAMPVSISGFTSGFKDDYQPCGAQVGGPDRVFSFSLQEAGTLTVDVTADFDVVLSAYTTCAPALDGLIACSDVAPPDPKEHLSLPGAKGATFYVVVDGYDAASFGKFTLTALLQ